MRVFTSFILFPLLYSTTLFSQVEYELAPPDYIKTISFKGNTPESQLPVLRLGDYLNSLNPTTISFLSRKSL